MFGAQGATNTVATPNVNFQNYLTEALGSTKDTSLSINLNSTNTIDAASLTSATNATNYLKNSETAALLNSLQDITGTNTNALLSGTSDFSSLLSSIQSMDNTGGSSQVSSLQGLTTADSLLSNVDSSTMSYSTLLSSLEGSSSNSSNSLSSNLSSENNEDMLVSNFKSDMFNNLNLAKTRLEGSYVDFAARIGDNITATQQSRLLELQNHISMLNSYMSTNVAPQAYEKAKQQQY